MMISDDHINGASNELVITRQQDSLDTNNSHFNLEKNRKTQCSDPFFAGVFIVQTIAVVGLALTEGINAIRQKGPELMVILEDTSSSISREGQFGETPKIMYGMLLVFTWSIIIATLWQLLVVHISKRLIQLTLWGIVVLSITCAVLFFIMEVVSWGVVCVLIGFIGIWYDYIVQHRIGFAGSNLLVACQGIRSIPLLPFAIFILIIEALWCILWTLAVIGTATSINGVITSNSGEIYKLSDCMTVTFPPGINYRGTNCVTEMDEWCSVCYCHDELIFGSKGCATFEINWATMVVLLFFFFCGCGVLANIAFCTTSWAIATWWFSEETVTISMIWKALKRSLSTSLGSIVLGSLIVGIFHWIRQLLFLIRNFVIEQQGLSLDSVKAFIDSLMEKFGGSIEYVNHYAFCHVALYGKEFTESGKSVIQLFKDRGWISFVNDDLVYNVLCLACVLIGALSAVVGYLYGKYMIGLGEELMQIMAAVSFAVGFLIAFVVTSVVHSAVSTVFVCFAEDPNSVNTSHHQVKGSSGGIGGNFSFFSGSWNQVHYGNVYLKDEHDTEEGVGIGLRDLRGIEGMNEEIIPVVVGGGDKVEVDEGKNEQNNLFSRHDATNLEIRHYRGSNDNNDDDDDGASHQGLIGGNELSTDQNGSINNSNNNTSFVSSSTYPVSYL